LSESFLMSQLNRRTFLLRGVQLPATLLVMSSGALAWSKSNAAACVDEDELSDSVQSMRESLEYTDKAADAQRVCNGCSFFKAEKPNAGCGHCEVLGGPVAAAGHCVSWTKRS
jgi:uncharacterized paraquat-inducible protein A